MTEKEILKLRAMARSYARRRLHTDDLADDFAQDFALKLVRGVNQKISYAFIDFLRTEFGSSKSEKGTMKYKAFFYSYPLESVQPLIAPFTERYADLDIKDLSDKEIFILKQFLNHFFMKEIGEDLHVCESRISQHLTEIANKLRESNSGKV